MAYGNIEFVISPADLNGILNHLDAVETTLPFLKKFTPSEQKKRLKISKHRIALPNDVINAVTQTPHLKSSLLDLPGLEKDAALGRNLEIIELKLESLLLNVRQNKLQVYVEAYRSAKLGKDYIEFLANNGDAAASAALRTIKQDKGTVGGRPRKQVEESKEE